MNAVERVQPRAHVARVLADGKGVRREADPNPAQRFLHTAAQRGNLPKAVFHYWFHNSAVLEALVQIHRTDILSDSLRRSTGLIEALRPLTDDRAQFDYFAAIITSGMIGVLTVWVEHGKTETEAQMVQKLAGAFAEMALLKLSG